MIVVKIRESQLCRTFSRVAPRAHAFGSDVVVKLTTLQTIFRLQCFDRAGFGKREVEHISCCKYI